MYGTSNTATASSARGRREGEEVVVGLVITEYRLFPWARHSTAHSSSRKQVAAAATPSHGRGEEEGEGEEEEAQGEGEGEAIGHRGGALQAERRGEGRAVRWPVHREVVHGASGVAAGAAPAAGHPAGLPKRVPEPSVPVDHGVHAHQLHNPGAPGVAHAHARPRHQEVQGCAVRVRVRGHEGRRGPPLAGHDPSWRRQQEAHPWAHRQRDGPVQVQEGLPHHLRLCRPPPRRRRLHVRRRPQEDSPVRG
uniref:Uncharacterized protein n=1 Tax=Leersia perrieri TaxID=77586 RepID=A0A0D9WHB2_9ORYZ